MAIITPITNINLKLVQTFLLVAEYGSFRHAAEITGRSQSAIGNQIRQLEAQLGVELFRRTTRQVRLTQEGMQLREFARRSIAEFQQGIDTVRRSIAKNSGRISLACSATIAAAFVPQALKAFSATHPDIEVLVNEADPPDVLAMVRDGVAEVGIHQVASDADFVFEEFYEDRICAIVPPSVYSSDRRVITVRQLSYLPLLFNTRSVMRQQLSEALRVNGLALATHYQFTSISTVIRMAEAGLGIALVPSYALSTVNLDLAPAYRLTEPEIIRQMAIITRRGIRTPDAAKAFADQVRQVFLENVPAPV